MKEIILITSEKFRIIICLLLIMVCCTKEDTPNPCNISGTPVNIGSTAGGTFSANVGTVSCPLGSIIESIYFDNTALNFWVGSSFASNCPTTSGQGILDAGVQTCLNFTYSGSPSAAKVSFAAGHGYVGQFNHGHIVKFIAKSYTNGKASIEYILQ
jgi:hypothetical protein